MNQEREKGKKEDHVNEERKKITKGKVNQRSGESKELTEGTNKRKIKYKKTVRTQQ